MVKYILWCFHKNAQIHRKSMERFFKKTNSVVISLEPDNSETH